MALSKARIVDAAITILDTKGEDALTFRALSAHLATGAGAIYWHVADKNELLAACTDDVIVHAVASIKRSKDPRVTIRATSLAVFDVLDAHPWVGAQLSREPWQAAILHVFERIGAQLSALGVPKRAHFNCASALLNYILGLAGQYAAGARLLSRTSDRSAFLAEISSQWEQHDPAAFPFVHQVASELRKHDDRKQFLAGIDLILAGIATLR